MGKTEIPVRQMDPQYAVLKAQHWPPYLGIYYCSGSSLFTRVTENNFVWTDLCLIFRNLNVFTFERWVTPEKISFQRIDLILNVLYSPIQLVPPSTYFRQRPDFTQVAQSRLKGVFIQVEGVWYEFHSELLILKPLSEICTKKYVRHF